MSSVNQVSDYSSCGVADTDRTEVSSSGETASVKQGGGADSDAPQWLSNHLNMSSKAKRGASDTGTSSKKKSKEKSSGKSSDEPRSTTADEAYPAAIFDEQSGTMGNRPLQREMSRLSTESGLASFLASESWLLPSADPDAAAKMQPQLQQALEGPIQSQPQQASAGAVQPQPHQAASGGASEKRKRSDSDNPSPEELARMGRSERKRHREKKRRSDVNKGFDDLMSILLQIDPVVKAEAEERARKNHGKSGGGHEGGAESSPLINRVELISRTVTVLERLHRENEERKLIIAQMSSRLAGAGIGMPPQDDRVMMMVPMLMPSNNSVFTASARGGIAPIQQQLSIPQPSLATRLAQQGVLPAPGYAFPPQGDFLGFVGAQDIRAAAASAHRPLGGISAGAASILRPGDPTDPHISNISQSLSGGSSATASLGNSAAGRTDQSRSTRQQQGPSEDQPEQREGR